MRRAPQRLKDHMEVFRDNLEESNRTGMDIFNGKQANSFFKKERIITNFLVVSKRNQMKSKPNC